MLRCTSYSHRSRTTTSSTSTFWDLKPKPKRNCSWRVTRPSCTVTLSFGTDRDIVLILNNVPDRGVAIPATTKPNAINGVSQIASRTAKKRQADRSQKWHSKRVGRQRIISTTRRCECRKSSVLQQECIPIHLQDSLQRSSFRGVPENRTGGVQQAQHTRGSFAGCVCQGISHQRTEILPRTHHRSHAFGVEGSHRVSDVVPAEAIPQVS